MRIVHYGWDCPWPLGTGASPVLPGHLAAELRVHLEGLETRLESVRSHQVARGDIGAGQWPKGELPLPPLYLLFPIRTTRMSVMSRLRIADLQLPAGPVPNLVPAPGMDLTHEELEGETRFIMKL